MDLLAAPERALHLRPSEAAALLARVEGLAAVLRIAANCRDERHSADRPQTTEDALRWLTPEEAAALLGVNRRAVYQWSRRADWRPFTRRLSRKVLRIEQGGLTRWRARQA